MNIYAYTQIVYTYTYADGLSNIQRSRLIQKEWHSIFFIILLAVYNAGKIHLNNSIYFRVWVFLFDFINEIIKIALPTPLSSVSYKCFIRFSTLVQWILINVTSLEEYLILIHLFRMIFSSYTSWDVAHLWFLAIH